MLYNHMLFKLLHDRTSKNFKIVKKVVKIQFVHFFNIEELVRSCSEVSFDKF